jgi:hypothetical protein
MGISNHKYADGTIFDVKVQDQKQFQQKSRQMVHDSGKRSENFQENMNSLASHCAGKVSKATTSARYLLQKQRCCTTLTNHGFTASQIIIREGGRINMKPHALPCASHLPRVQKPLKNLLGLGFAFFLTSEFICVNHRFSAKISSWQGMDLAVNLVRLDQKKPVWLSYPDSTCYSPIGAVSPVNILFFIFRAVVPSHL